MLLCILFRAIKNGAFETVLLLLRTFGPGDRGIHKPAFCRGYVFWSILLLVRLKRFLFVMSHGCLLSVFEEKSADTTKDMDMPSGNVSAGFPETDCLRLNRNQCGAESGGEMSNPQ